MNCNCDFGSDYNSWGEFGTYLPLVYGIYYNGEQNVKDNFQENIVVKGDLLFIPESFEIAYVERDTLVLENPELIKVENESLVINNQ